MSSEHIAQMQKTKEEKIRRKPLVAVGRVLLSFASIAFSSKNVVAVRAAARLAAVAAGGDGRGKTLEQLALPEPENQERDGAEVVVHQVNWYRSQRFQAVLSAAAIFCRVALLVHFGPTLWIRIKYRDLLRASTREAPGEHADLPLFSGCDEAACQQYMAAISASANKSQDQCDDLSGFVCDGRKHRHHLLSVVDAAEDTMYKRVLSAIERASQNGSYQAEVASSSTGIERSVAALARSRID
ncbi:hypothetical protein HPB50_020142 [Hyalomma asiaticum]|uniref:Uncharacterized protein n=1 Tax=Hyalomma asiaticum TaxID=266040 RepID=A0ACB7S295_HYAAI|nr:hypothetical protein HPB50_020142 [Hyalomma asiaticum]